MLLVYIYNPKLLYSKIKFSLKHNLYNLQHTAPDITALLHPRSGGTILTLEFPECSNVLRTRRASYVTQPPRPVTLRNPSVTATSAEGLLAPIIDRLSTATNITNTLTSTLPASHSATQIAACRQKYCRGIGTTIEKPIMHIMSYDDTALSIRKRKRLWLANLQITRSLCRLHAIIM